MIEIVKLEASEIEAAPVVIQVSEVVEMVEIVEADLLEEIEIF